MRKADPMPARGTVDPLFDGHHERPFHTLTAMEKLDWLWATIELVHAARKVSADDVGTRESTGADDLGAGGGPPPPFHYGRTPSPAAS